MLIYFGILKNINNNYNKNIYNTTNKKNCDIYSNIYIYLLISINHFFEYYNKKTKYNALFIITNINNHFA